MANPKLLSHDEYRKLVASTLNTSDFQIDGIEESAPNDLVGFMGNHTKIKITVLTGRGEEAATTTELSLFAKSLPSNVYCRELAEESNVFAKEDAFYNAIAKDFDLILSVDDDDVLTYPAPLLVRSDLVVLEDMRPRGYVGVSDFKHAVDRRHSEQALAVLARFHTASIVMERSTRKTLRQLYPQAMFEFLFAMEGKWGRWIDGGLRAMRSLIPLLPEYQGDASTAQRLQERFRVEDVMQFMKEFVDRNSDTLCVLCHGDAWITNFLFRCDEQGQPVQAMLVDFQQIRYAPPAFDVMYFLARSVARGARRAQTVLDLQQHYHARLADELRRRAGIDDIESVLPWDEFERTCRAYAVLLAVLLAVNAQTFDAPADFIARVYDPVDSAGLYDQYVLSDRSDAVLRLFREDRHFREAVGGATSEALALLFGGESPPMS